MNERNHGKHLKFFSMIVCVTYESFYYRKKKSNKIRMKQNKIKRKMYYFTQNLLVNRLAPLNQITSQWTPEICVLSIEMIYRNNKKSYLINFETKYSNESKKKIIKTAEKKMTALRIRFFPAHTFSPKHLSAMNLLHFMHTNKIALCILLVVTHFHLLGANRMEEKLK